jgi:phosphoribosylanthranilate isomerase
VNGVAALVRLGAVQLHGDERPADARLITTPVIKSFAPAADSGEGEEWIPAVTLLLDAHDPVRRGGTGHTIDWSAAARIAARRRVLLAGGLTPENVADAIVRVGPYGIDVSSGIEREPGRKDASRVRALFDEVRRIARQG